MIVTRPADRYDVVVIGAGPAGLAAALGARHAGAERVLLIDREREPGGILQQCIHTGFGLQTFDEELTGPEFAERFVNRVMTEAADLLLDAYVLGADPRARSLLAIGQGFGSARVEFGALVLAMGCRERTRGALRVPGTRPAGVYTAGLAQKLVNMMGVLPGRRAVILGSGDIGLIMARRLVLEGCEVLGVFEIQPYSSGLNRNIVQCLDDFDIPLHLSRTLTYIGGRDRVEWVETGPVDERMRPVPGAEREQIDCDTVLLSVGLIPENELSVRLGVRLDAVTHGPVVDSRLMTNVSGVFACGNVLHVHDVVDWVAEEAGRAGRFAAGFALGRPHLRDSVAVVPGENVRYVVPGSVGADPDQVLRFRVTRPFKKATITLSAAGPEADTPLFTKRIRFAVPAEMQSLKLKPRVIERGQALQAARLRLSVVDYEAPRRSKERPG